MLHRSSNRVQGALLALTAAGLGFSLVNPLHPRDQVLQHAPTTLALVWMWVAVRRRWCSTGSFACLVAFIGLHIYGARYVYTFTPGGESLTWLALGSDVDGRNHYDRLVHGAFGLLFVRPLTEWAMTRGGLRLGWALAMSCGFVAGVSALYEVAEWLLTRLMASEEAHRYNGQQGDAWDAQHDMALAIVGSVIAIPMTGLSLRRVEPPAREPAGFP